MNGNYKEEFINSYIQVYDIEDFVYEVTGHKARPFVMNEAAIIYSKNGKGVIVDYEAIGKVFDSLDDKVEIEVILEKEGEGKTFITLMAEGTIHPQVKKIISLANSRTVKVKEFFSKCLGTNWRCADNFRDLLDELLKDGYFEDNKNINESYIIVDKNGQEEEIETPLYKIVGKPNPAISYTKYRYVSFGSDSKEYKNPVVVTECGMMGSEHQPLFKSKKEAQSFIDNMIKYKPDRKIYNLTVKEYDTLPFRSEFNFDLHDRHKNYKHKNYYNTLEYVDTKYGKCLRPLDRGNKDVIIGEALKALKEQDLHSIDIEDIKLTQRDWFITRNHIDLTKADFLQPHTLYYIENRIKDIDDKGDYYDLTSRRVDTIFAIKYLDIGDVNKAEDNFYEYTDIRKYHLRSLEDKIDRYIKISELQKLINESNFLYIYDGLKVIYKSDYNDEIIGEKLLDEGHIDLPILKPIDEEEKEKYINLIKQKFEKTKKTFGISIYPTSDKEEARIAFQFLGASIHKLVPENPQAGKQLYFICSPSLHLPDEQEIFYRYPEIKSLYGNRSTLEFICSVGELLQDKDYNDEVIGEKYGR